MKENTVEPRNSIPQIPRKYINTAKILQFFSKSLATSFAVKLFGTPIKHRRPEREQAMAKSAKVDMVYIPSIKKNIKVFSYGYSKRKVLLVHGWSGRGTQLYRLADKLLENGFMVISFDAPAHGDSEGKTTLLIEFIVAALSLQDKYGPFEAAIGHSLGGLTVLNGATRGLKLKKVVSISAGDGITFFLDEIVNNLQLKPSIATIMKRRFLKKFGEDMENFAGSEVGQHIAIPTLIVHDTQDKEVPVSCAYSIRQTLKNGSLLITDNLGHRRVLNDATVIENIVGFIKT